MSDASTPWLGVIADDYTGATDVAGYLVREGTPTVQFFGVPKDVVTLPANTGCVVIALKSRSIDANDAVSQSLEALAWLRAAGVEHVYFKYCSTFDSTSSGNIGPVADALADELGASTVVFAPSAPENFRTVYEGKLFVGKQLLEESPLREHPLNPMRDSDLVRLLSAQSSKSVGLTDLRTVSRGADAVHGELETFAAAGVTHVVADAITNGDLDTIARAVVGHPLSTGSAGLGAALARSRNRTGDGTRASATPDFPEGHALVLSGSCSSATQTQVANYSAHHPSFLVDPLRVDAGMDVVAEALAFVRENVHLSPLVFSTTDPESVASAQATLGVQRAAELVESTLSAIAVGAAEHGVRKFVVAGGETSGAVVSALGVSGVRIGEEVAVGVPWSMTLGADPVALILKSGNFGGEHFFDDALETAVAR